MWSDAVDCSPMFIFDVQLKDGSVIEARHIMGNFETMDGQVLYPERFAFKECRVVVPLVSYGAVEQKRASDALETCDNNHHYIKGDDPSICSCGKLVRR